MAIAPMPLITGDKTMAMGEVNVPPVLTAKIQMWNNTRKELQEAADSVGQGADRMEGVANWNSTDGAQFVANNRNAKKNLLARVGQIDDSKIQAVYGEIQEQIATTVREVVGNYNKAQAEFTSRLPEVAQGLITVAMLAKEIDEKYHALNKGPIDALNAAYGRGINAANTAASGPEWQNTAPQGSPTSTPSSSPSSQQTPGAGGDQAGAGGGAGAGAGGAEQGQQGAGEQQQEGGEVPPGVDPGLSGGAGQAPQIPPGVNPTPNVPTGPPVTGGTPPMVPIGTGGLGAGVRPGGGGGGGGGGPRIPGVGVGAGSSSIPSAANPIGGGAGAATVAGPGQLNPGAGVVAGGTAGGGGGGGGGMPPMMPPMGGMGAGAGMGGRGGGPGGPGAVSRPRERKRPDGPTPGLPGLLTGKAGAPEAGAFRRGRTQESDIPSTVQLIDEDLWQVEEKAPAVMDQPAPVRRVRR